MDHKAPKASFCGVKKKFPTTKQKNAEAFKLQYE